MPQGKLIVIDGTDGSGKTTQTELLARRFRSLGLTVQTINFPQYRRKSAGLIEEYLSGNYGTADEVGPYIASIFYACDRYDASFQIRDWLAQGQIVIANRYVTANLGHQGAKIADPSDRQTYYNWLNSLEYELFGIPKPDLTIILHLNTWLAQKLAKNEIKGSRDLTIGSGRDIHEDDLNHLRQAEMAYQEIASLFPDFAVIECAPFGQLFTPEAIADQIWKKVIARKIIIRGDQLGKPNHDLRILKVERLSPLAKLPARNNPDSAGFDIYACDYQSLPPGRQALVRTGIRLAFPAGYLGLICGKNNLAESGLTIGNNIIDTGYHQELLVSVINHSADFYHIVPGQKIAQLLIQKITAPEVREAKIDDHNQPQTNGFSNPAIF